MLNLFGMPSEQRRRDSMENKHVGALIPNSQSSVPFEPDSSPPLAIPSLDNASRSSTPALTTRKTPFHLPKTLVLDLDETLIHSTSRPMTNSGSSSFFGFGRGNTTAGHVVEVVLGGRSTLYHVYKRPFVDFFLRTVCGLVLSDPS
jgi:CTD nuclear envelope phosphatase 1